MSDKDKHAKKIAMMLEVIEVIGDDVTSDDIIRALRAYQKKREAARETNRRRYVPRGTPTGRPSKEPIIFTGDLNQ